MESNDIEKELNNYKLKLNTISNKIAEYLNNKSQISSITKYITDSLNSKDLLNFPEKLTLDYTKLQDKYNKLQEDFIVANKKLINQEIITKSNLEIVDKSQTDKLLLKIESLKKENFELKKNLRKMFFKLKQTQEEVNTVVKPVTVNSRLTGITTPEESYKNEMKSLIQNKNNYNNNNSSNIKDNNKSYHNVTGTFNQYKQLLEDDFENLKFQTQQNIDKPKKPKDKDTTKDSSMNNNSITNPTDLKSNYKKKSIIIADNFFKSRKSGITNEALGFNFNPASIVDPDISSIENTNTMSTKYTTPNVNEKKKNHKNSLNDNQANANNSNTNNNNGVSKKNLTNNVNERKSALQNNKNNTNKQNNDKKELENSINTNYISSNKKKDNDRLNSTTINTNSKILSSRNTASSNSNVKKVFSQYKNITNDNIDVNKYSKSSARAISNNNTYRHNPNKNSTNNSNNNNTNGSSSLKKKIFVDNKNTLDDFSTIGTEPGTNIINSQRTITTLETDRFNTIHENDNENNKFSIGNSNNNNSNYNYSITENSHSTPIKYNTNTNNREKKKGTTLKSFIDNYKIPSLQQSQKKEKETNIKFNNAVTKTKQYSKNTNNSNNTNNSSLNNTISCFSNVKNKKEDQLTEDDGLKIIYPEKNAKTKALELLRSINQIQKRNSLVNENDNDNEE